MVALRQRQAAAAVIRPLALAGLLLATHAGPLATWGGELVTHVGDDTIRNWQVEQGLPQISVTSIAQTPDGYLWVGTFNGLARFDGVRFTIFDDDNTPELGNSAVTHLQVDEHGALWIVTGAGGLVRMAAGQFTTVLKENIRLLLWGPKSASDADPPLLLLLNRQGEWRQIQNNNLVPLDPEIGKKDALRFLFENGCLAWAIHQGKVSPPHELLSSAFLADVGNSSRLPLIIYSAGIRQAGGYWVSATNGLYQLQQGQLSPRVAPLPTPRATYTIQEDGQGDLWVACWGQGLYRLNAEGSWQTFGAGTGLADNFVNCLFRDREGSLWVGTGQGGLHRVRPRLFQVYNTESGPNVVTSVTQDRQGRLWFGVNGGGLHTWAEGKLKPVMEPAMLREFQLTYAVRADRQEGLWIGLYGNKALSWHNGAVKLHPLTEDPAEIMTPHALFEDRSGTLWAGCTHGLVRYQDGRFARCTIPGGLSADVVNALAEDRSGNLYVGTGGRGLYRLAEGQCTHFTERDDLPDMDIVALYVDGQDTLWIGTAKRGLSRFQHGRFTSISVKDGLPSKNVASVLEDNSGHLWLGSNRGIVRVSRSALNAYLDNTNNRLTLHVFGLSDGLSTIACTGGGQPRSWKTPDGKLWFATAKGAAVVDPATLPFNPMPPPVNIEEIIADDRAQAVHGNLASVRIPPRTHRLEFRFTALSLVAPEKVRFRFRLEPFDRDWVEAGTQRVAYYSGVPPGRYHLRVTACNNDGAWNETGARLGLVVLPPWWMTVWFRASMVIGAAGLVFGGYELRLHRLRREQLAQENFSRQLITSQENERRRIAGELHDGLGQDLLVIANQAQFTLSKEENSPGAAARLNEIADTARKALQQARSLAHNLRPGLLEELGFTEALQASAETAAQASGISIKFDLANVDGLLPPEFEVNLFRIAQEALNNVLKHASASEIKVTLTHETAVLRLIVEDNGRGFEPDLLQAAPPGQRGLGMRQISERARMMGGHAGFQSSPDHGTRLTVEIPLEISSAGSWSCSCS